MLLLGVDIEEESYSNASDNGSSCCPEQVEVYGEVLSAVKDKVDDE